jgi:sialate O-acetylesterase
MMKTFLFVSGLAGAWCGAGHAAVRVPAIIGEHMMLQAGAHTPIYGWANPGEAVAVSVGEAKIATTTGADGKWQVVFKDLKPTATPVVVSIAGNNTLTYQDVLIGDVWLCSGQSNMALPVRRVLGRDVNNLQGLGQANHPQMRLFKLPKDTELDPQPDCKGSWAVCTPAEAREFSALGYFFGREIHRVEKIPIGLVNACRGGSSGQMWTSLEGLQSEPALANYLNQILAAKADYPQRKEAYLKWKEATARWPETLKRWETESAKALAEGSPPPAKPEKPLATLARPEGMDAWEDQVMSAPTVLFNSMIAPIIPFGIKGAIWYQGEGNADEWELYRTLFPAMVRDWRKRWDRGDFPIHTVQLSSYRPSRTEPGESNWAAFREIQTQLQTIVANSGMAVTVDIGNPDDIHPLSKAEVGRRLSLVALAKTYNNPLDYSGPLYQRMEIQGGNIRLHFTQVGGGLAAKGDKPLKRFAIAGADKKFAWGDAKIDGRTVVVSCPQVPTPVAVRYAWDINPDGCNLFNAAGLPASPFRTDDWKLEFSKQ